MANTIQFDLASPKKLVFSKPVSMVVVPGSEGMFGVLPDHAPMDTGISMGLVDIYEQDVNAISEQFFIVGGFCEVTGTYCTVMADDIVPVKSLKREIIEEEIKQLSMLEANDENGFKLAVAHAKLMAVGA